MRRRMVAALTAVVLVSGMVSLAGVSSAGACEEREAQLSAVAHSYDAWSGHYVDGVVTNDTTQTMSPTTVKITWAGYRDRVVDEWLCSGPLAPGQWASFHFERPRGVSAAATPTVVGYAWPSDSDVTQLPVDVSGISSPTTDDAGVRSYTATVTNPNAVPVSSLGIAAVERADDTTGVVDTLQSCDVPDSLAPGASARITLTGEAPYDGVLTPDVHVSALEQPTLNLSADTTSPVAGGRVTFSLALLKADGTPAEGSRGFELLSSKNGDDWCDSRRIDSDSSTASASVKVDRTRYYKAVYWGGDDLGYAESTPILVAPQPSTVPSCPPTAHARRPFKISGYIGAGGKGGSKVTIYAERKHGARWVEALTSSTTANGAGTYSKSVKLSSTGDYRIRAYRAGVGYTPYTSLKVKK